MTQSERGGLTRSRNSGGDQMFENGSAAGWVGGESWEAEWMPLPSQSPQYWDFPLCPTQPEEMVMMSTNSRDIVTVDTDTSEGSRGKLKQK